MSRRYENEGRDQINIEHVQGDVHLRSRRRSDKEITWLKAFEKEVEGRLATSLHNQILINLGKQAQPEQVHRLWDMEIKSGQITETISPDTEILAVFDRAEIAGKLLILGKPGAGKTTTLLELARALVRKALDDPSEPMPFLLNLSSWKDPKQSIEDWTIAELSMKGIGSKIGAKWLEEQKFLPLFDGLDEVRSDLQPVCVNAINRFLASAEQPRAIVVCSRREEYELYSEKLNLNGAIYLQELSDEQIENYLRKVDRLALWQVLDTDAELLNLVRQPLLLSITLVAYRQELAKQWQALGSTQERLTFLLDAYVEKMLHRQIKSKLYAEQKEPTPQQTCQWLVRLAKQMRHETETEFLIEKMQPTWLRSPRQKWCYHMIFELIFGLIGGLIFGLGGLIGGLIVVLFIWPSEEPTLEPSERLILGLIVVLFFGLISGLFGGLIFLLYGLTFVGRGYIYPVERFRLFFKDKSGKRVLKRLLAGLIVGLLIEGLLSNRKLIFGSIFGSIFGLISGLISELKSDIETRYRPNQGIFNSAKNAGFLSIIVLLGLVVVVYQLIREGMTEIDFVIISATFLPWLLRLSVLEGGGKACVQHFSLRLVLFLHRTIPWNYARFLNYATERMFLQRIGGRYRFIHKLLQDHFAAMSDQG